MGFGLDPNHFPAVQRNAYIETSESVFQPCSFDKHPELEKTIHGGKIVSRSFSLRTDRSTRTRGNPVAFSFVIYG